MDGFIVTVGMHKAAEIGGQHMTMKWEELFAIFMHGLSRENTRERGEEYLWNLDLS